MPISRKKRNYKKHTIKNFVVNEFKRCIKYNSEEVCFFKLRNKMFNRLRNRGFRNYASAKLFSLVSYSSRYKHLLTRNNIYFDIIQETQADVALIEMAEDTILFKAKS